MAVVQLHGMLQMEVLFAENLTFQQEETNKVSVLEKYKFLAT